MVTNALLTLPTEAREAGWRLWDALRVLPDLPIVAFFWAEFDESDWRLFLATPLVATVGQRSVYGVLQTVLGQIPEDELHGLSLFDIVVANPEERMVRAMQRRYGHTEGDRRTVRRLSLSSEDAYVYYVA